MNSCVLIPTRKSSSIHGTTDLGKLASTISWPLTGPQTYTSGGGSMRRCGTRKSSPWVPNLTSPHANPYLSQRSTNSPSSHLAGAHLFTNFFRHSFPIFSHQVFHEHYGGLKELLTRQNRPYLEWRVEDGWRPLCEFLDVDVPDREFPSGNTPKDFAEKFAERHGGRMRKARRNLLICAGVVATVGIWGAAQRGPGWGSSALGHWVGGIRQWIQVSL